MPRGPLEDTLRTAIATALATDTDAVTVTVEAPGWAEVRDRDADVSVALAANADDDQPEEDDVPVDDPADATAAAEASAPADDERGPEPAAAEDEDASAAPDEDEGTSPPPADAEPSRARRDEAPEDEEAPTPEQLDEEADAAADFLEALLDAFDLPGDLRIRVSEEHAEVEVVEVDGGALIGRRGQTLDAIQELVRCSLQRQFQRRTRVRIDVEGYRARRMEKLEEKTADAIDEALDTGKSVRMEPMDVFERKAVHGMVARHEGVASHSQGREPGRRVIIEPA